MKDYYKILNVNATATDDEIKRSYRLLAKRYHPDLHPGDASAADRFADINEAHDVLSDPKKRAEYDKKVKEAAAPKLRPEDVIARQRAAAQAAARQAAMRNNMGQRIVQTPNMTMAQRMAAAQAQAQAAAAAQAQAAAQQYQAQLSAVEKQAYAKGHEKGASEAKAAADKEISKLKDELRAMRSEKEELRRKLVETEHDRSDLENELFNRDRELGLEKARAADAVRQMQMAQQKANAKPRERQPSRDYSALADELEQTKMYAAQLEQERNQAELKSRAQLELQQNKRKELQAKIDDLNARVSALTAENEALRSENEQWQQYAKSEDFLSNAEKRMQEWDIKQKADKKLAKPTLYGTLGVLIWATQEEIDESYAKLEKRYSGKEDFAEKLQALKDAYATLSDHSERIKYNASIGISEERIAEERRLIAENEQMQEEYRNQLEDKEFWAEFDELTFNAQTGDADSQNRLGEMYYYGDEIEQDLDQAIYWFKEAAKQKHADAMYNLGVCFINGEGVDRNENTGLGFVRQAAKLGSKAAIQFTKGKK